MEDNIFYCDKCDYITCNVSNYKKHLVTKKHAKKDERTNTNQFKKKETFYCSICHYITNNNSNYKKHLVTNKHQMKHEIEKTKSEKHTFMCSTCNYSTQIHSNFTKHCQTYKHIRKINHNGNNDKQQVELAIQTHKEQEQKKDTHEKTLQVLIDLIKENTEIQNKLIKDNMEMQNKLLDLAKQPKIINNKNTFNIIQYLNTDCKDAYNLNDFIQNISVSFDDLALIEQHGYVYGVRHSLIKALHETEQTKRPIHCTDIKRKQFFIKNNDQWARDKTYTYINTAINQYNNNQIRTLYNWKNIYDTELPTEKNEYKTNKLTKELTTMYLKDGHKARNKIVSDICNATYIDQKMKMK